jgi:precorrin-6B methylase 2
VFWDIGCGAGRPLAIASMNFPMLSKCCGVELLDGLYNLAKSNASNLLTHNSTYPDLVPIEIF